MGGALPRHPPPIKEFSARAARPDSSHASAPRLVRSPRFAQIGAAPSAPKSVTEVANVKRHA